MGEQNEPAIGASKSRFVLPVPQSDPLLPSLHFVSYFKPFADSIQSFARLHGIADDVNFQVAFVECVWQFPVRKNSHSYDNGLNGKDDLLRRLLNYEGVLLHIEFSVTFSFM